jgi:uncharacterized protein YkwD
LRKLGALALAIPVVVAIYVAVYLGSLPRRSFASRIGAGIATFAIVGLVVVASLPPSPSTASPASGKPAPVGAELLDAVRTGHGLTSSFTVRFAAPMDAASVAAAVRIEPESAVTLAWDEAGTTLLISPVEHWLPDTLYSVTVADTARAVMGGTLERPLRALVLTERAGSARIAPTGMVGKQVRLDTAFRVSTNRDLAAEDVLAALRVVPYINGDLAAGEVPGEFLFRPYEALMPGTTYRIWLEGLSDGSGVAFASLPELRVTTTAAPRVVRFRPRDVTKNVARTDAISVRFTERMDRTTTAAAFRVSAAGKPVAGSVAWAEKGTVLVFEPKSALPYGATVTVTVDARATSKAGVALAAAATGTFTVQPKPKPKPVTTSTTRPITKSGGGGAVSGSWRGVESYYLQLMNCTRTGGWVTSEGNCSSPGGRDVAALALSSGISDKVSRPYAKLLATRGECSHFIGGNPGDRLRRAGYTSYRWAENLGCRSGNPYSAVLGSHRYFQSEKPYNGGHYRNMMNPDYDRAGIGVWVSSGRVRLVVDFYHP